MQVEPVRVINIDNRTYDVGSLPATVQTLVGFYNDWRQKEADLKSDLLLTQAAVREISREIVQAIQAENAKAAEATPVDAPPATLQPANGELPDPLEGSSEGA